MSVVHYKSRTREQSKRRKNEYRWDERLKTKSDESTCLVYTGLHEELEHPKEEDEVNKEGLRMWWVVYYELIKRELKIRGICECRCDERLLCKTDGLMWYLLFIMNQ